MKDAWDAESSEEEDEPAKPEPVTPVKEEKKKAVGPEKAKEKEVPLNIVCSMNVWNLKNNF